MDPGKQGFWTRWLGGAIRIDRDEMKLDIGTVKLIPLSELVSKIDSSYNAERRKGFLGSIFERLKNGKEMLDGPAPVAFHMRPKGHQFHMSDEEVYKICNDIARRLNKKPSELTISEISSLYREGKGVFFGVQSIATIFNDYARLREENERNEWLRKEKNKAVHVLSDKDFEDLHGPEPWGVLNNILDMTFKGKFNFSIPIDGVYDPGFITSLCLADGTPIDTTLLSSGEQTLLWLALAIFQTKYSGMERSKFPEVLLLDEPDAYLHPSMVVNMLECLKGFSKEFDSYVIISTHSPTTVALSPEKSLFLVGDDGIKSVEQDAAISDLLEGVTQVSVSPSNRRQVYVEGPYDTQVYQILYAGLRKSIKSSKVSLEFCGLMKMPEGMVEDSFRSAFKGCDIDVEKKRHFIDLINGLGGCVAVKATVDDLVGKGATTVRGLIDRDKIESPNVATANTVIIGGGECYSIENLVFNPVCILQYLYVSQSMTMLDICGDEVGVKEWIADGKLFQASVDVFVEKVLGRPNNCDAALTYVGGHSISIDLDYMNMRGHDLVDLILKQYAGLKALGRGNVSAIMVGLAEFMVRGTDSAFIPSHFLNAFVELKG